ncbi:MAG: fumarylacetoacetate hydrolase family protein [Chitinophagaceae bacterium]|nr:fumarylacetoacetate hydrolase family protein [Anaerolineae bacterium]
MPRFGVVTLTPTPREVADLGVLFSRFPQERQPLELSLQGVLAAKMSNILIYGINKASEGTVNDYLLQDIKLHSPVYPSSLRDFYAFEQHVKTANQNRGRDVPEEWYEFPVFYFANASAIYGPDDVIPYPSYSDALDYELEIACVIGKEGRDIKAENAEDYIFGYMIFNDWSARDIQRKEMKVGLGPAKGKDFANSFGPYLVTPDELADRHTGRPSVYDLEMIARVNGVERSRGNMKDLYWSFGQMIEHASKDVTLYPGEVIGSGTVGTGCLLETTKGAGPWLQTGDVVELEIERLGILRNVVGEKRRD